jgi:serine/threonine protein kinase
MNQEFRISLICIILLAKQSRLEKMSLSDFVILSKIGEGSFSSVHKVNRTSDKKIYALKQVLMG